MKLLLFGKNTQELAPLVKSLSFELVEKDPDVVLSYGGDGTLLAAEHNFPNTPKLPIRDSQVCIKCAQHSDEVLLTKLKNNELTLTTYQKLEANFLENRVTALNDIVIRNALPTHAIRFTVKKNGQPVTEDTVIGDGVIAATPFGSTGYFQSITRKTFDQGFGLAFNNPVREISPLFFQNDIITIEIVRGPATLSFDNSQTIYSLGQKDTVEIKASSQKALIYSPQTLRCPDCKILVDG